jgi:feruloyl esterase
MFPRNLPAAVIGVAIGASLAACSREPAGEPFDADAVEFASCEDLTLRAFPSTTISAASSVAPGAFAPPAPELGAAPVDYAKLPAFCRVVGSIKPTPESDIGFEVWLPEEGWNGRFMQTGNGGAAGSIVYGSLAEGLARGYAVANTDTGHRGGAGDFSWATDQPEKLVDYQYRAVHELTVVGKAITEARYGVAPEKSYWNGCSTGGRQGLKEAQRYPEDYDAIVAGAPANNWSPLMALSITVQRNLGPGGLSPAKLPLLTEGALAMCDALDGVSDRVIADPSQCAFDPATLACGAGKSGDQCLAPNEVAAAKRLYAGVVNAAGETLFPGTGPASEQLWAAYASPQFAIGTSFFRQAIAKDPSWDPATFDAARDLARAEQADAGAAAAMDPDLSAFTARGGKLLMYHGTADGLIPYRNTVNYYESVVAALGTGAAGEHVRLYLVPGMSHCAGGEGASVVDWLGALEGWVERGEGPTALQAEHPAVTPGPPGAPPVQGKAFTRPVCVYPQVLRYKGSGDETVAASFECA